MKNSKIKRKAREYYLNFLPADFPRESGKVEWALKKLTVVAFSPFPFSFNSALSAFCLS